MSEENASTTTKPANSPNKRGRKKTTNDNEYTNNQPQNVSSSTSPTKPADPIKFVKAEEGNNDTPQNLTPSEEKKVEAKYFSPSQQSSSSLYEFSNVQNASTSFAMPQDIQSSSTMAQTSVNFLRTQVN